MVFKPTYLSFFEWAKKRKHHGHITKSGSYEQESIIYFDYGIWASGSKKLMFKSQPYLLPTV